MVCVDDSCYPVVFHRFVSEPSMAELQAYFAEIERIAERALKDGTYYVIIAEGNETLSAAKRNEVRALTDRVRPELRARTVGSYVVLKSSVGRAVLVALRWLMPSLAQIETHETRESAISAALARLAEKGIDVPTSLPKRLGA